MKKPKIVLLDAHSIIHRAYHALPDFSNSKGEPTGALYGIVSMLISIISELKPDYILAAYDLPQKTKRHEIFEDYKAGRKKADDALVAQIKKSKELLKAFSIPVLSAPGYEADDIIGTLAVKFKNKADIIIASGDLDMLQLVDGKKVRVFTLKRSIKDTIIYDEQAVKARFGFTPEYVVDFKALQGDASDNIPGVKGIGLKTATNLIQKFGHLEDIYKALEKNEEKFLQEGFKERVAKLLKEGKEDAFFSKTLATIALDAPVEYTLPDKKWAQSVNAQAALGFLNDLELRSLAPRFEKLLPESGLKEQSKTQDEINTDSQEFKETAIALWLVRSDIIDPKPEDIFNFAGTRNFKEAKKIILKTIKDRSLTFVYENIEKPLIPVVDKLNATGVKVDPTYFKKLSQSYHKELGKLTKNIYALAGCEFNINSPLQLSEVLFDKMGIKANLKKTATGRYSTRESELEKIIDTHPIIGEILKYREFQKLLSTYVDNLPKMVSDDGRLRTRFVQAGTTTGRMASVSPNLQNIPIRTDLGKAVRRGFVAETGFCLVSFDYSQIELKIAAILSGDEYLIQAFKDKKDIHSSVASRIFNVKESEVTSEMRRVAKAINFGILYGMGVNALKKSMGVKDVKEAREFLHKYFDTYKGLANWIDKTKADVARKGYSTTLFGRRRYFEGVNSDIPYIRAQAERMAVNAPVQGTQADIIKMAMKRADDFLQSAYKENAYKTARLVLQVHDELIYEVSKKHTEEITENIRNIMEGALNSEQASGVPVTVDVSMGDNWGEI